MMKSANYTFDGDHFVVYTDIKSQYCTPKTNIMLYGPSIPPTVDNV